MGENSKQSNWLMLFCCCFGIIYIGQMFTVALKYGFTVFGVLIVAGVKIRLKGAYFICILAFAMNGFIMSHFAGKRSGGNALSNPTV